MERGNDKEASCLGNRALKENDKLYGGLTWR